MSDSTRARPRFLVTRDGDGAAAWCRRLEELGYEPVRLPLVRHEVVDDPALVADLRRALDDARWLAFSSARGVDAVVTLLGGAGEPPSVPSAVLLAAVGPKTAARCREAFGRCELVPDEASGADLARRFLAEIDAGGTEEHAAPVLVVAAADRGRRDFEAILAPRGVEIRRFAVYSTRCAGPVEPRRDLAAENLDAVLLASPSAVTGLERVVARPETLRLVTLGATTSAAVRALGLPVFAQAAEPSLDAMIDAWAAAVDAGERPR